jgi:hypothetical protein
LPSGNDGSAFSLIKIMENWLCLQTMAGQEAKLAKALNDLGIDAYAPSYLKIQKVFSSIKEYARPFFPTYLFATTAYHQRKSAVQLLPTRLKSRVIGNMEHELIEQLWQREQGGYIVLNPVEKRATVSRPFKNGDHLIYSGMANFEAVFDSYTTDDERVIILATMFNQQKLVPVSIYDLALAV